MCSSDLLVAVDAEKQAKIKIPPYREAVVLGLASLSFLLGLLALLPTDVVMIGRSLPPAVGLP